MNISPAASRSSRRDGTDKNLVTLQLVMRSRTHTFASTMHIHRAVAEIYICCTADGERHLPEPIISDEVPFQVTIRNVTTSIWINVLF